MTSRMTRYKAVTIFALLFMVAGSAVASNTVVRQIEIKSYWGGLGTPQKAEAVIISDNGVFKLGRKVIEPAKVNALILALQQSRVAEPNLENLGITPDWLKANAVPAATKRAANFVDAAPNQRDLYIRTFTNLEVMNKLVPRMFKSVRFDDYPSVGVVVTFDDGHTISAQSRSWDEFMLPWNVSGLGEVMRKSGVLRPEVRPSHIVL